MRVFRVALALIFLHFPCLATTGADLSARIRIDGSLDEYQADEWILDANTVFPEAPDDSRWGSDNDVGRVAVTWDDNFLYIGVEASIHSSALMVLVEHTAGGVADLVDAGALRRNVLFSRITPNLLFEANRASTEAVGAVVGILDPLRYLDPGAFSSRFYQPVRGPGALEIAVPWTRILPESGQIRVLVFITAGPGTGAGDAAPDPRGPLPVERDLQARLDNAATLTVDRDYDGEPDHGISPRNEAIFEFAKSKALAAKPDFEIRLDGGSVTPDTGDVLRFRIHARGLTAPLQVYQTCEVFSVAGDRVRVLFRDELRTYDPAVPPPQDSWDGRDDSGEIVDGGIYIINVTSGASTGAADDVTRKPAGVVR